MPEHDHVAPHESWQMEQLGNYPSKEHDSKWFRSTDRYQSHIDSSNLNLCAGNPFGLAGSVLCGLFRLVWVWLIVVERINYCMIHCYLCCFLFWNSQKHIKRITGPISFRFLVNKFHQEIGWCAIDSNVDEFVVFSLLSLRCFYHYFLRISTYRIVLKVLRALVAPGLLSI